MTVDNVSPVRTELSAEGERRVRALMARMTLEEKLAQLVGLWEGRGGSGEGGDVAPLRRAVPLRLTTTPPMSHPRARYHP